LRQEFIDLLRCPETRTKLALAPTELLEKLNGAIAAGTLKNRIGQVLTAKLDGGLLREDAQVLYPIFNEIPILLTDEGISLGQFS